VLASAGAAIGASVAWLAFNETSVSAMTGISPSQLTFALDLPEPVAVRRRYRAVSDTAPHVTQTLEAAGRNARLPRRSGYRRVPSK